MTQKGKSKPKAEPKKPAKPKNQPKKRKQEIPEDLDTRKRPGGYKLA